MGFKVICLRLVTPVPDPVSASARATLLQRLRSFLQAGDPLVQLRALVLLLVGWLLSPLCWWNDLLINLPLAWGFAGLLQFWHPDWFAPGLVIGYWLTNVLGIVLMQSGAITVFHDGQSNRNPKRELLIGLATSTLYTIVVMLLVQFGLLPSPISELS
jgi:hypothetical protein